MGAWRAAALATEFGFAVVGSLVGGIVLGLYLDRRLGTSPVLFILGLIGGLLFSLYLMYAIYRVQVQPRRQPPRSNRPAAQPHVSARDDGTG